MFEDAYCARRLSGLCVRPKPADEATELSNKAATPRATRCMVTVERRPYEDLAAHFLKHGDIEEIA